MQRTETFKAFLEDIKIGKYQTPLDVPPHIFQDPSWTGVGEKEYFDLFHSFIQYQTRRAASKTAIYAGRSKEDLEKAKIESLEDFYRIPGLPKDTNVEGIIGVRSRVTQNMRANLPSDILAGYVTPYFSGGTKGSPVPTWITKWDKEVESSAFAMLFREAGINPGATVFWCYNIQGHKGGEEGVYAMEKLGCELILPKSQLRAPEILAQIKQLRSPARQLVLDTVPILDADKQNKGSGRTLGDFLAADIEALQANVDLIHLGGDKMTPRTLEYLETPLAVPTADIYGATEALPVAWDYPYPGSNGTCTRNNMHALNGPHFVEIVKSEDGVLVPTKPGERGMMAVTNVFRQGTPYIRYLIGDGGEISPSCGDHATKILTNIDRETIPSDIQNACASD